MRLDYAVIGGKRNIDLGNELTGNKAYNNINLKIIYA